MEHSLAQRIDDVNGEPRFAILETLREYASERLAASGLGNLQILDGGVPLSDLVAANPDLGDDAVPLLAPGSAASRRTTAGGAGPGPVARQLARFRAQLEADADRVGRA